jgi:hypothetical protein
LGNAVTQALYKEGLWDEHVKDSKAPWIHVDDGKFNFGFLVAYSGYMTMAFGSKGGEAFSQFLQKVTGGKMPELPPLPPISADQKQRIHNLFRNLAHSEELGIHESRITEITNEQQPLHTVASGSGSNRPGIEASPTSGAEAALKHLQEHWQDLPEEQRRNTEWQPHQFDAFAKALGYRSGHRVDPQTGPDLHGLVLDATHVVPFSEAQQTGQLRIKKLPANEKVDGQPLKPGTIVRGNIDSLKQSHQHGARLT